MLSRDQAAAYIGVSSTTLSGLPIAPLRVGARVLYDRRNLDRWADNLSGAPGGDESLDDLLDRL